MLFVQYMLINLLNIIKISFFSFICPLDNFLIIILSTKLLMLCFSIFIHFKIDLILLNFKSDYPKDFIFKVI